MKGTVSRDFRPSIFFLIKTSVLGPWSRGLNLFEYKFEIAKIFIRIFKMHAVLLTPHAPCILCHWHRMFICMQCNWHRMFICMQCHWHRMFVCVRNHWHHLHNRVSFFNENFILGSCHPAVVSFWCKKCKTGKKNFSIARAHPGAASKKRIRTYM
jgi:hypothetical protein